MIDELNRADIYRDIGQAFAVLLPVKSVGVMGDSRYRFSLPRKVALFNIHRTTTLRQSVGVVGDSR